MATQYMMQRDTASWRMQVWISFGLAILASAVGVLYLPGQELDRAFLAIGLFFSYYFLINLGLALGKKQLIAPVLAGWLPNLVFLLIGIHLIRRMR